MSRAAANLPPGYLDDRHGYRSDRVFSVTEGREYVVYAVTYFLGGPWIYIADDDFTYFPVWYPSPIFAIVDPRLSASWRAGLQGVGRHEWVLTFREWADDPTYYERLVNHDDGVVSSFLRHKALLDEEYS